MNDLLLRRTLHANVAISGVWGLAATVAAPWLAEPLGLTATPIRAVGLLTLAATVIFWKVGSRQTLRATEGRLVAIGDAIFGTGLLVAALAVADVTVLGRWVVGLSGVAVLDLGLLEWIGARRIDAGRRVTRAHQPA